MVTDNFGAFDKKLKDFVTEFKYKNDQDNNRTGSKIHDIHIELAGLRDDVDVL